MDIPYKSALPFVLLVVNAVLGSLFFGYSISYLNSASNFYPIYYLIYEYDVSTQNLLKALVGGIAIQIQQLAIFTLSAGAGAILSGNLLQQFSIRKSFMITDFIGIIGVVLEIIPNIYWFYLARIFIGFCVGLNSSLIPLYIKEFSPNRLSGSLGAMNQLTINIGVLIGLISAFDIEEESQNDNVFRLFLELPLIFCLLRTLLLIFVFKNEPPSYYVQKNQLIEAKQIVERYYLREKVDFVLEKIKSVIEQKKLQKETYRDLIMNYSQRKRLLIGCGLQVLQQFSGINAIMFFSKTIFSSILNNNETKINWANVAVGLINIIFSFLAISLLQKFGRRTLLLYGTIVCTFFLSIAFGFSFSEDPNTTIEILIVFAIFGYLGAFQLSLGPVAWIYDADILSEKGMSLAVLCNWISCTFIAFAFVILDIEHNKERLAIVFGVFTGCCILGVFFILKFVRETKDRTQSAINIYFSLTKIREEGLLG
ncbi:unnamed protein product (macronuclear) [Paramecium tetraurelia]|uniref:Hexose transporter 1 n=1 Tax=Paramecium tetraurelia TaxID=5888 RepID=A0E0N4_PARTE|nr:uncharacterized protein GSPATT00022019001 [Paramecium tetraurelia]CAK88851.1 unnamed protein product [Paramecium tetraurelia]|eukprot:XP_001456248.1 hypothetical protein (macronuclear) [Paramecium tetraurelia strain d4-2]